MACWKPFVPIFRGGNRVPTGNDILAAAGLPAHARVGQKVWFRHGYSGVRSRLIKTVLLSVGADGITSACCTWDREFLPLSDCYATEAEAMASPRGRSPW